MHKWLIRTLHRLSLWHSSRCSKCSRLLLRVEGKFRPDLLKEAQGHPEYRQVLLLLEGRLKDRLREWEARETPVPRDILAAEARTIREALILLTPKID